VTGTDRSPVTTEINWWNVYFLDPLDPDNPYRDTPYEPEA